MRRYDATAFRTATLALVIENLSALRTGNTEGDWHASKLEMKRPLVKCEQREQRPFSQEGLLYRPDIATVEQLIQVSFPGLFHRVADLVVHEGIEGRLLGYTNHADRCGKSRWSHATHQKT